MRADHCEVHGTPLIRHPEDAELTTEPANCPLCDAVQLWLEAGEPDVDVSIGNALRMLSNIGAGLVELRADAP